MKTALRRAFVLEAETMAVGQYVTSSEIIPACCSAVAKDLLAAAHQNIQTVSLLIVKKTSGNAKCKVTMSSILR